MKTIKRINFRNTKALLPLIGVIVALVLLFSSPVTGQQYSYDQDQQRTFGQQNPGQQNYGSGSEGQGYATPYGGRMGDMDERMGRMDQRMGRMDNMGRMQDRMGMSRQDQQSPHSGQQGYRDGASDQGYGQMRGYMQEDGSQQSQNQPGQQQTQPGQQQTQGAAQQPRWQLEQQGMVRIGYDLNNDGQLDTFQYIPYFELQRMRQQYQDRMQPDRQFTQRFQSPYGEQEDRGARGYYEEQTQARQRRFHQRLDTVEGRIQETKTIRLAEMNEPHVIARIATQDNRLARVDLGPQKKVSELDIKQNDQVKVLGTPGTINDKPALMAHYIVYNQQQQAINRPQDKNIRRYSGKILKTRTTELGGQGENLLMARVRLQNGNTTIVNLGPEKELQNKLNVQQGKTVNMLARPSYIAGQKALVAESVSIDNQFYDVQWKQTEQQQRQQEIQQQQQKTKQQQTQQQQEQQQQQPQQQ